MEAYERFVEISSSPFKHCLPPQPLELFTTSHHTPVQLAIRVPLVSHSRSRSSSILQFLHLSFINMVSGCLAACFRSHILQFLHLFIIHRVAVCLTMFPWVAGLTQFSLQYMIARYEAELIFLLRLC
jgi:hypothetical protein